MPEPKSEYADLIARLRATDGKGQGGPAKALAADAIESLERRLAEVTAELDRVRLDCAEAYQVVGALTNYLGMDDGPDATKPLDNLRAAVSGDARPHSDLLPYPKETPPVVAELSRLRVAMEDLRDAIKALLKEGK